MRLPILASAAVLALSAAAIGQVATAPVEDKTATLNNAANAADMPPPGNGGTTPDANTAAPNATDGVGTDAANANEPVPAEAKPPR